MAGRPHYILRQHYAFFIHYFDDPQMVMQTQTLAIRLPPVPVGGGGWWGLQSNPLWYRRHSIIVLYMPTGYRQLHGRRGI